jgi:hypothetical protein
LLFVGPETFVNVQVIDGISLWLVPTAKLGSKREISPQAGTTCDEIDNERRALGEKRVYAETDDVASEWLDVNVIDPSAVELIQHQDFQEYVGDVGVYAKGLRQRPAEAVVSARENDGPFTSAEDLALRVPLLSRKELTLLAKIGALNSLGGIEHRRDALWQVERAGKMEGPLFRQKSETLRDDTETLPLQKMNTEERLVADYAGKGDRQINVDMLRHSFDRVRKFANVTRNDGGKYQPRLCDLRVTFAVHRITSWIKNGADLNRMLPALAAYMGQVGLGHTDKYLSLTPERFHKHLSKLSPGRANGRWRNNKPLMEFIDAL